MTDADRDKAQSPAPGTTTYAAEEASLDRRVFHLDAAQYEAFERALDAPARPTATLRKLLARPAPWER